ncbi:hypothetical protein L2E82_03818 [Cichorium intybus]|uniref:Uncharacterized protein n=1 Tax=Cichorium intybus TaxID=13427 RepID=A0ACB9H442_CICIN|nr:hypothetical protein L2E82_03818 [Cichorium intybus]
MMPPIRTRHRLFVVSVRCGFDQGAHSLLSGLAAAYKLKISFQRIQPYIEHIDSEQIRSPVTDSAHQEVVPTSPKHHPWIMVATFMGLRKTREIPQSVTRLKYLESFEINWTNISSNVPSFLAELKTVWNINLLFNNLSGPILLSLATLWVHYDSDSRISPIGAAGTNQQHFCENKSATNRENEAYVIGFVLAVCSVVMEGGDVGRRCNIVAGRRCNIVADRRCRWNRPPGGERSAET